MMFRAFLVQTPSAPEGFDWVWQDCDVLLVFSCALTSFRCCVARQCGSRNVGSSLVNLDIIPCLESWSSCLPLHFSRISSRIVPCLSFKIGLKDINDDFLTRICNFAWINVVCRVDALRNPCSLSRESS